MLAFELATVMHQRFAGFQCFLMDSLPGVGIPMPDGFIRAALFIIGEKRGKGLGDGAPFAVFLIPAVMRSSA